MRALPLLQIQGPLFNCIHLCIFNIPLLLNLYTPLHNQNQNNQKRLLKEFYLICLLIRFLNSKQGSCPHSSHGRETTSIGHKLNYSITVGLPASNLYMRWLHIKLSGIFLCTTIEKRVIPNSCHYIRRSVWPKYYLVCLEIKYV